MVPPARLERATYGLEGRCSIQLSYGSVRAEATDILPFGFCQVNFLTSNLSTSNVCTLVRLPDVRQVGISFVNCIEAGEFGPLVEANQFAGIFADRAVISGLYLAVNIFEHHIRH